MSNKKRKIITEKKPSLIDLYFLLISAIIILPLIYTTKSLDPNLASRLLFLGVFILGIYIINYLKPKKYKYKFEFIHQSIFLVLFVYLIWSIVTLIFATNPSEGLFDINKSYLTIILLILATQIFIKHSKSTSLLTKGVIISSIVSSTIGLFQYLNNVPGKLGHDQFLALYEVSGLMAQKNQFAIMLFLMLPFTIYGVFTTKKYWKVLSILSTSLILLVIILVQTRAVWLATFVFLIILMGFGATILLKKQNPSKIGIKRRIAITTIISILIISSSYFIIHKIGAFELMQKRVTSIFDKDAHDNQGRLQIWESTINMSKDNLLMGVGAGNWKIMIPSYFPYNIDTKYQNWRRPHNDFLWILSEKGVFGLLFYIFIFIFVFYYGIYIITKVNDSDKKLLSVLILSGLTGYLIISMFTFPIERIHHQVYISIMIAVIVSDYILLKSRIQTRVSELYVKINPLITILVIVSIYYSYTLLQSEVSINKLMYARERGDWKGVVKLSDEAFSKLITLDAYSSPIHLHRGEANIKMNKYKDASKDLITALKYFPDHISVLNNLAITSSDMNNNAQAIKYLDRVLEIYPKYEASLYNKANVYHRNQEYENAFISLLSCNTQKPRHNYQEFITILKTEIDKKPL